MSTTTTQTNERVWKIPSTASWWVYTARTARPLVRTLVVHNGTHDVCEKHCPIDQKIHWTRKELLFGPERDGLENDYKGQAAEHYQWAKPSSRSSKCNHTLPTEDDTLLGAKTQITLFGGPAIGGGTVSWEGFKAGTARGQV